MLEPGWIAGSVISARPARGPLASQRRSLAMRVNETASVCFRDSGEVKYVVRAESASDPSGEQNIAGTISIGSEDQASRPVAKPVEKNEGLAQSDKDEAASSR